MVCAPAVRLALASRHLLCWMLNSTSLSLSQPIDLATAGSSLPLYGVICMMPSPLSKLRVVSGSLFAASCIAVASRISGRKCSPSGVNSPASVWATLDHLVVERREQVLLLAERVAATRVMIDRLGPGRRLLVRLGVGLVLVVVAVLGR